MTAAQDHQKQTQAKDQSEKVPTAPSVPTSSDPPKPLVRGGIDPAALAAASLAAAVSVMAPEGPYKPMGMVIGFTIAVLIFAYDIDPNRTRVQSAAFAMVVSLVLCLVYGYIAEEIYSSSTPKSEASSTNKATDGPKSMVPDSVMVLCWVGCSFALWFVDRWRVESRPSPWPKRLKSLWAGLANRFKNRTNTSAQSSPKDNGSAADQNPPGP